MRSLKDFHAWSVLCESRDVWISDSRAVLSRVCGGGFVGLGGGEGEEGEMGFLRANTEGWRKEYRVGISVSGVEE